MRLAGTLLMAVSLAACSPKPQAPADPDPATVLQAYVDAWNRHDSLAIDTLLAPAGVHEDLAWSFHGVGPAAVNGFMRDVMRVSPDYHWVITSSFTDGHNIAGEWTWTATFTGLSPTGPVTNQHVAGRGVAVAHIVDGKIARLSDYYDAASFFPKQAPDSARQ